jgi:hypothetical protein
VTRPVCWHRFSLRGTCSWDPTPRRGAQG